MEDMNQKKSQELLKENIKQEIISRLIMYKDQWKDEIPDQIIHSTDNDRNYKVRKGWWSGVLSEIETANDEGLLSDELKQKFIEFSKEYYNENFTKRLTTIDDVKKMNQFINELISYLK